MSSPAATQIHVGAHPGVIRFLEASEAVYLRNFEADTGRKVILMINETLEATSYQVSISEVAA
jgi:hypothetical protein